MTGGEQTFLTIVLTATALYSAVLLWLTLTYRDNQNIRPK